MKHILHSFYALTLMALFLLVWRLSELSAGANPTGGSVAQGAATIKSSGSQVIVNQTSPTTFINWSTFDINNNETVIFNQPSSTSIAWNYIQEAQASTINGTINANGYVILQNPNGFVVGGTAAITAHGLIMTTASTPNLNLSSSDPWTFNTPPPSAKIINYGQINTAGGPAYLIANNIVNENGGTISAKGGAIGLYAGETVLVSMSPNGEGLSAKVTLPQGSVDNEGNLIADGGTIAAEAQTVNQNGLVQANSVQNVNGVIELVGSDSVTLGASSTISTTGDSTASSASQGGSVQIQSGTSFSDAIGSSINVSGASQGGNAGQVSISAPQLSTLNSTINGQAAVGYLNGSLSIDTADIALNSDGSPVAGALALDIAALSSGFSQINLQASGNITLSAPWTVAVNGGVPSSVSLQAGTEITLASGSGITANGGNITLKAPTVDEGGTLQANSVGSANGVIEIDASQNLILEPGAAISAIGDSTASTPSPGGFVVLNAGTSYSDSSSSTISVSGNAAGGQGGILEILDPQAGSAPIQSIVSGAFAYLVNPFDMTLSGNTTGTSYDGNNNLDANFNLSDLAAYSQMDLFALDNIELSSSWALTTPGTELSLTAGNNITLDNGAGIAAGKGWNVNLTAGTSFIPTAGQPTPVSGSDGIYLDGSAFIQIVNGNANLWAANEVQIGWTGNSSGAGVVNPGAGGVTTTGGGNISVTTSYGDVNAGSDPAGYNYLTVAPYYSVSAALGGISTAAGGNVTINAGGNVISYLPVGSSTAPIGDGGIGAFGPESGNVSITAGGNVEGGYVLANGAGTITAGNTVGAPSGADSFALSLIAGTWNVNAPNGNIYLQEVRNPNGDFNNAGHASSNLGYDLFNYAPDAAVSLDAGVGVYLTDVNTPRYKSQVQVIYPSILNIIAGSGGVTLQDNITLFPSVFQNLNITTTDGGSLVSDPNDPGTIPELLMSDSSQTRWNVSTKGITAFSDADNGSVLPIDSDFAVTLDIAGDMDNLTLITTKATQITVNGNMENCGFSGQNLQASDITSITVDGEMYNQSSYSFVNNITIPGVPAADLLPGMGNFWNDIFTLAVDPTAIANLNLAALATLAPTKWADYILEQAAVFGDSLQNGALNPANAPNFVYNAATGQLGYGGQMSQTAYSEFGTAGQSVYVLHLVNGVPVISNGQLVLDQVNWAPVSAVQTLYTDSINAPDPNVPSVGYRIGGPGEFDIDAGSISLGNSSGILSCGVSDPAGGFDRYSDLASITPSGATLNVTVSGDLDMQTSTIATLGGGDVNLVSTGGSLDLGSENLFNQTTRQVGFGVFTAGPGDVSVIAPGDIDIDGSRIATFDGGNIFIESTGGNVDIGNGGNTFDSVFLSYVDPSGNANHYVEGIYGSGIVAYTLSTPEAGASYSLPGSEWPLNHATAPGNIKVETPQGNITSGLGGITQESLNAYSTGNPTITLLAGTAPTGTVGDPGYLPGFIGNINLGPAGLFANTVIIKATGNVTGPVVATGNATITAGQNFNGSLISGGIADVSAVGDVSGLVVGLGGVSVSGGSVTADVLGQDVSINGGASESTLGSTASATSASQSAANQSDTQAKEQLASNDDDDKKKKKKLQPQIQRVKRVTVFLPNKS